MAKTSKNDILNVGKGLGHMHQHFSIYITGRSPNRTIFLKGNLEKKYGNVFKVYLSCEPAILPLERCSLQINNSCCRNILSTEVTTVAYFIIEKNRKSLNVQKGGLVKQTIG